MLNFKNTNIIFLSLFFVLLTIHQWVGVDWYFYLLLFIVYSLIVFYGCYHIGSNFFIKIICAADSKLNQIAISFDDGPSVKYTTKILELLEAEKIEAVFFCIGNRIKGNENIIQNIIAKGHIIGNHSYSHHFWFDMFSAKKMEQDLELMDTEIKKLTGLKLKFFRPPYGVTNPNLAKAIVKRGYIPIGWSVRSMDTISKKNDQYLQKIIASIQPGAIFLFHDTALITLQEIRAFIEAVKKSGYTIVRLDKLLNIPPYA